MTNEKQTPHLDKTRLAWCPTAHASRTHHEKQQEQEAALKLELRKKAARETGKMVSQTQTKQMEEPWKETPLMVRLTRMSMKSKIQRS